MIEVLNLANVSRRITKSISFSIEKGEIVGLLGPCNIETTKICDMLTGFVPFSGNITIEGNDLSMLPANSKSKIGYMPEKNPLYLDMTVLEYLKFVAEIKKVFTSEISAMVTDVISKTDITSIQNEVIETLSNDSCKKLCFAAALIGNPEVLILDRPFSGISSDAKNALLSLIKESSSDKAVLITGTDSESIFERVIDLNNEEMIEELDKIDEDAEIDELLDNQEIEAILEEELLEEITEVEDAAEDKEDVL